MNWSSTEQPAWRDRGNITGTKESTVKQKFDDKGCVWNCGGKVRFLGCLKTWLLFFMVWEVSSVMVQIGQDTWKITHFMWSWAMCSADPVFEQGLWTECTPEVPPTPAVLCCCGSNFGICPQSCLTSLYLVISHSTGINTLFPGTAFSAGSGWSSPPTWRCLTSLSCQLQNPCLKTTIFCSSSGFTPVLGGNPRKGRHWPRPLLVKVPVCKSVEKWRDDLWLCCSAVKRQETLCVCLCVLPPCNYSSSNYCN